MPRTPRKCGSIFWIWTFLIGVFSPGKGKRRINARMKELEKAVADRDEIIRVKDSDNTGLKDEVQFLREQLAEAQATIKQLEAAQHIDDCMAKVVNLRTPSWSRKDEDEADTQPIPQVG